MALSIGIVGLPNVGKSTLFNALTQKSVPAENFPFCTIDPSVGIVAVPDERLQRLSTFSHSKKTIPAAVEFVDIAGLVAGASKGEGLGNQFLAHIREVDVIAQVVRIFDNENIVHVHGEIKPINDIEVVNLELIMADTETVSKRLHSVAKEVRAGEKDAPVEKILLERLQKGLDEGGLVRDIVQDTLSDREEAILKNLHLLTSKPILYVLNRESGGSNLDELSDNRYRECVEYIEGMGASYIELDAGIEAELTSVAESDKDSLRRELSTSKHGVDALIKKGYEMLGLITFFTTGEDETRGWTTRTGSTAPQAGAAIHTDFKDKFIRADVIAWNVLLDVGSQAAARENGLIKTVGREYLVQDGDVIEFKI